MDRPESLSHSLWVCKYHVVFIPKCRRRTLYVPLRRHLGEVFRNLARQKESTIEEGHLLPDHVHMLISMPAALARALAARAAAVVQTTAFQAPRPSGGGSIRRKAFQAGVYPPPAQPTGFSR